MAGLVDGRPVESGARSKRTARCDHQEGDNRSRISEVAFAQDSQLGETGRWERLLHHCRPLA